MTWHIEYSSCIWSINSHMSPHVCLNSNALPSFLQVGETLGFSLCTSCIKVIDTHPLSTSTECSIIGIFNTRYIELACPDLFFFFFFLLKESLGCNFMLSGWNILKHRLILYVFIKCKVLLAPKLAQPPPPGTPIKDCQDSAWWMSYIGNFMFIQLGNDYVFLITLQTNYFGTVCMIGGDTP